MYTNNLSREQFNQIINELRVFVLKGISLMAANGMHTVLEDFNKEAVLWIPTYKIRKLVRKKLMVREYSIYSPYSFLFLNRYDDSLRERLMEIGMNCRFIGCQSSIDVEPQGINETEMRDVFESVVDFTGSENEEEKDIIEIFREGDRVLIIAGPFKSCEGIVTGVEGRKVMVEVGMFGRGVPTECDASILQLQLRKEEE